MWDTSSAWLGGMKFPGMLGKKKNKQEKCNPKCQLLIGKTLTVEKRTPLLFSSFCFLREESVDFGLA